MRLLHSLAWLDGYPADDTLHNDLTEVVKAARVGASQ